MRILVDDDGAFALRRADHQLRALGFTEVTASALDAWRDEWALRNAELAPA